MFRRPAVALLTRGLRHLHPRPSAPPPRIQAQSLRAVAPLISRRAFASTKSEADAKIEELQELYATAKDEFEIATEETEKKSLYARDDRAAAREELAKLKEAYDFALNSPEGTEIKNRIGQRLRELEAAIEELNKADFED